MIPHKNVKGSGEEPLEEEGVGGGTRVKKLRVVSDIGGSSLMPSYTEPSSESEEEEVPEEEFHEEEESE